MRYVSLLAMAGLLAAGTATAQVAPMPGTSMTGPATMSGPRAIIARELPHYGFRDVDVRALSTGQVAQIYALLHSNRSHGDKRGLIGSTLSRDGILQRAADSLTGRL